jgi:M6 family metalloprotease-like protein
MKQRLSPKAAISRFILAMFMGVVMSASVSSAPLWFEPFRADQPDGTTLRLFKSGDEFFNWAHDTLGFPVQVNDDGYYYYMYQNDSIFSFSAYRVGLTDPLKVAALKRTTVPSNISRKREAFYKNIEEEDAKRKFSYDSKWSGTFNNLVIYIKFSDQPDFSVSRTTYDNLFNSLATTSVRHYYREISYNKTDMVSHHSPGTVSENIAYTDTYSRNYYRPYNATTNTIGYSTDAEKTSREHGLLARAVKYINENYQSPAGANFDSNNDGYFDNVAFIVKGTSDAWNDLLWPHRWVLYSQTANLWGSRVYSYTFQLENVSVKTFTHEMFHALGAPDLYHYNNNRNPVGIWDLMASGSGHPTAWMKSRYGGWIESIPEITNSGTYSIRPLTESAQNSYRIASPFSIGQYFIVEFRKKSGLYESKLPSEGLIITRIDSRYRGNAQGPPDEVYVFRPGGSPDADGEINKANFSNTVSRSSFNDVTNPYAFLQDGGPGGIFISNITWHGDSMTFTVNLDNPLNLTISAASDDRLYLNWTSGRNSTFIIAASSSSENLNLGPAATYSPGDRIGNSGEIIYKGTSKSFTHTGLESDELYYYTVWAVIDEVNGVYSMPLRGSARSGIPVVSSFPYSQDFSSLLSGKLPSGWKAEGGANQWSPDPLQAYSDPYALLLTNLGTGGSWLFTPGFHLSSQTKYLLTFRYRADKSAPVEAITLHSSQSRHDGTLAANIIYTDADAPKNDYVIARVVVKPAQTGTWYFALKSGASGKGVLIDDFKIETAPSKTRTLTSPAEFYPNPATDKIIVPAKEKTVITIVRHDGKVLLSRTIEGTSEIDISSLEQGIYYLRFTGNETTKTSKLVVAAKR